MPHYERLYDDNDTSDNISPSSILKAILDITSLTNARTIKELYPLNNSDTPDFTGRRVSAYMILCQSVILLDPVRKTTTGMYRVIDKEFKFVRYTPDHLKTNKVQAYVKKLHAIKRGILSTKCTQHFQRKVVDEWNPKLKDVSCIIIPPVSLHDEIKTDGYGMAVIELLTLVGILIRSSTDCNIDSWELSKDWNKKTMILCLDGLSIDRHRSFMKKLIKLPLGFTQAFRQSQVFHKALNRVIKISGPLHMTMHMLQSIYTIFEDILLLSQQCVQWKKVKASKVSDSFRLCESLCFICYDELFRYFLLQYLSVYEQEVSDTTLDDSDDNAGVFGVSLTKGLYSFICLKAEESTYDRLRYMCNFLKK